MGVFLCKIDCSKPELTWVYSRSARRSCPISSPFLKCLRSSFVWSVAICTNKSLSPQPLNLVGPYKTAFGIFLLNPSLDKYACDARF